MQLAAPTALVPLQVCQGLERYIEEEDEVLPPSTYGSSVSVGVKGISKVEGMLSQSVQVRNVRLFRMGRLHWPLRGRARSEDLCLRCGWLQMPNCHSSKTVNAIRSPCVTTGTASAYPGALCRA